MKGFDIILRILRRLVWWVVETTFEQTLGAWPRTVPADAESGLATSTLPSDQIQSYKSSHTFLPSHARRGTTRQLHLDVWRPIGAPTLAPGLGLSTPGEFSGPLAQSSPTAASMRTSRADHTSLELRLCRKSLGSRKDLDFIKPAHPRWEMFAALNAFPFSMRGEISLFTCIDTYPIAILHVNEVAYEQNAQYACHRYNLSPASSQRSTIRPSKESLSFWTPSTYQKCIRRTPYMITLHDHREEVILADKGSFINIAWTLCVRGKTTTIGDTFSELEHHNNPRQSSRLGGWLKGV
jgi:hypothetical protein